MQVTVSQLPYVRSRHCRHDGLPASKACYVPPYVYVPPGGFPMRLLTVFIQGQCQCPLPSVELAPSPALARCRMLHPQIPESPFQSDSTTVLERWLAVIPCIVYFSPPSSPPYLQPSILLQKFQLLSPELFCLHHFDFRKATRMSGKTASIICLQAGGTVVERNTAGDNALYLRATFTSTGSFGQGSECMGACWGLDRRSDWPLEAVKHASFMACSLYRT